MTPAAPLGLLALLAVVPVVVAYLLRRRQPPRRVSALFLWRQVEERSDAGRRVSRLSREVSLALELTAVALAAAFLAQVQCTDASARRPWTVVLDGSLSMRARVGGRPVFQEVQGLVASEVRARGVTHLTVVESSVRPRLVVGPQARVEDGLAAVQAWTPRHGTHALLPALALARELDAQAPVTLYTDAPWPAETPVPPGVEVRAVGQPLDNVALAAVERQEGPGARLAVRVVNFGAGLARVPVALEGAGGRRTQEVQVPPGGSAVLEATLDEEGPVTVRLPDDALPEDGVATLGPRRPARVRLELLPGLEATAAQAARRFAQASAEVTPDAPGEGAVLSLGPRDAGMLRVGTSGALRSLLGPFFARLDDALLEDVHLEGVTWTAGEDNPPGAPLVSAGPRVLLSREDDGTVHLNLDVSRSNLHRTSAWPVLLANLALEARARRPGFARPQLALGEEAQVVVTPGAVWTLHSPSGQARALLGPGALTVEGLDEAGRWRLERDGVEVDALDVLGLDERESDLRGRGTGTSEGAPLAAPAGEGGDADEPWWALWALLAVVVADQLWTGRRASAAPASGTPR